MITPNWLSAFLINGTVLYRAFIVPYFICIRFHSAAVCYSVGLKTDSVLFSADFAYGCSFDPVVAVCFRTDFDFFLPLFFTILLQLCFSSNLLIFSYFRDNKHRKVKKLFLIFRFFIDGIIIPLYYYMEQVYGYAYFFKKISDSR